MSLGTEIESILLDLVDEGVLDLGILEDGQICFWNRVDT
jgi:hypothetical protein